jgi:type I restriction enzyme M protein
MAEKDESSGGNHDLPFAKHLWEACDRLRGSVESAEYKHLVLGLVFLKYISDSFERRRSELETAVADPDNELFTEDAAERAEILEDRDEYVAENVFWVPPEARWDALLATANQPDIGERLDAALEAVERENEEQLRGVLPRVYARAPIEAQKLGELVTTIAKVGFGDDPDAARDILGRTYEYFIREFARAEGHRGGEFFTPRSVVRLLVEMLEPYEGRVLDPACGSCGMFIQSADFVERHGGRPRQITIYGQENNQATWRIGRMNLAIHALSGDIRLGDSLLNDQHPGLKADFVLANPPFNQDKWGADQVTDDGRWSYGAPPNSNANYAWIQHFVHHLAPDGRAGFVMANGSLTTQQSGEGRIREGIVRDDLVDCIVACPGQLFYTTQIPVCLWFLDRNKRSATERDRGGELLFIDARQMGRKISRTQIELTDEEIERITGAYHAWRGTADQQYEDVKGFCAAATLDEIEKHGFALTPGRYVGAPESEEDEIEFEERMAGLVDRLAEELAESERVTEDVRRSLRAAGYEL